MKTFTISDELAEELSDQLSDSGAIEITSYADFVGKSLFIRTVTYHWIGKVVAVNGALMELEKASVVFSSGNLSNALKTGQLSESESIGTVWVNIASITDIFPWSNKL